MALVVADRVWETTSTSGTGTLTLSGAVSGYQTFAAIGDGNTTYYTITTGTDWEVGIGTYTSSGTTLSRDTVLSSSLGGATKINVIPGSFVFCDYPASKAVYEDASDVVTIPTLNLTNPLGISYGGTGKATANAAMANLMGFTSTATAGGTTTLTNTSSYYQLFTGSTTQTVVLPVTSTLQTGWTFHICNNSTGSLTVNSSGGNLVISVIAGTTVMCTCIGTTLTTAADWEAGYTDFSTLTGTGNVVLSTSPTFSSLTATGTLGLNGTSTSSSSFHTNQTSGVMTIGGTAGTGLITIGRSTVSQQTDIQAGATASGSTKTVNIGTAGLSGSTTNINIGSLVSGSLGTTTIQAPTVNIGQTATQFQVTNTASAVNYIQATGSVTNVTPIISSQGSDAAVGLTVQSKSASILFVTRAGQGRSFNILDSGSPVNYAQAQGTLTGFGPILSAQGSDTNIPLVLQPKGTGALQAQQTDSTATGGNARGANAVDWQTNRSAAANVSSGTYSVLSGGQNNRVDGYGSSVAGGQGNFATGVYGFIGNGLGNLINSAGFGNAYSGIVTGYSNTTSGVFNFIGGGYANSGTASAAVTTQSGTMNGTTAVTLSGSNANIKVGQIISGTSINSFPPTYVAAISGTSLTLSQAASGSSTSTLSFFTPHGVVVGGGNNQATGSYSFIGGGGDAGTAGNRNTASGDWSFVGGGRGNTASGIGAVVCGGGLDGGASVLGSTASAVAAFVGGGLQNQATATGSSILGGYQNIANGTISSVLAGRYGNTRSIAGYTVIPACNIPIAGGTGVSQSALLILAVQTTDATATALRSDANAASTTNQVILPNNSAYYFRGEVISGVTGGGNTKGWFIEGVIKRGANAASTALVGTPTVTSNYADAGASTWTIAVTADTTNGGLAITFTGQAGTTIRTVAQIRTTEMTF